MRRCWKAFARRSERLHTYLRLGRGVEAAETAREADEVIKAVTTSSLPTGGVELLAPRDAEGNQQAKPGVYKPGLRHDQDLIKQENFIDASSLARSPNA